MASAPAPGTTAAPAQDPVQRTKFHLYSRQLIERTFTLPAYVIGVPAAKELATEARKLEGRCTAEGLVRSGSTTVASYSAGVCEGPNIVYNAKVECDICSPVPGQRINKCEVKAVTKIGIRAIKPPEPSPVTIFVPRDHYGGSEYYQGIKEGDEIDVVVTAPRFQLNDTSIALMADVIPRRPYSRSVIQST
jgi:hypothetical protein